MSTRTIQTDLTRDSIFKSILRFSIPYLLANILQALYGSVDTWVVSTFSNTAAISSVGTGGTVMSTVNAVITGMAAGGTVLIGQYFGAKMEKDVKESIGSMFTMFAVFSVALAIVLFALARPIASLMQVPEAAVGGTISYLRICFVGLIFTSGYNAISAILRAMGDTKRPLLFISVACGCNIALDLLFVAVFKMDAAGAALATTISQSLSFFIAILYLKKKGFVFDFKRASFKPVRDKIKRLLKLGIPIGLQDGLAMVSFMFLLSVINKMGLVESAAASIGDKILGFFFMPPGAFSAAIAAFTAQNIGANQMPRAKKGLYTGIIMGIVVTIPLVLIMLIFPDFLMGIFSSDAEVIAMGRLYMYPYAAEVLLLCPVFAMNGFFNGCGRTTITMTAHLVTTFLVRIPAAWLLSSIPGANLASVSSAAPISTFVQGLILLGFMWYTKRKDTRAIIS